MGENAIAWVRNGCPPPPPACNGCCGQLAPNQPQSLTSKLAQSAARVQPWQDSETEALIETALLRIFSTRALIKVEEWVGVKLTSSGGFFSEGAFLMGSS